MVIEVEKPRPTAVLAPGLASVCVQNQPARSVFSRTEASKANCINNERAMGIEPTSEAWEARNKKLETPDLAALSRSGPKPKDEPRKTRLLSKLATSPTAGNSVDNWRGGHANSKMSP